MPAPRADLDRDAIAASIALRGIRATARALDLPVATVQDIARAGKVIVPGSPLRTVTERVTSVRSVQEGSVRPAHAQITDELARNGATARLAMSQIAARTLPHVADLALSEPETALAHASNVSSVVASAQRANVPGFEREAAAAANLVVNVALLGVPPEQPLEQLDCTVLPGTMLDDADPGSV